jgi:hypothetical protein
MMQWSGESIRRSAQFIPEWLPFSDEVLFFFSCSLSDTVRSRLHRRIRWVMNWKGFGRKRWWPSRHLPGGTKKECQSDDRCSSKIRTQRLPNTSAQHYRIQACSVRDRFGSTSTLHTDMKTTRYTITRRDCNCFFVQRHLNCADCARSNENG